MRHSLLFTGSVLVVAAVAACGSPDTTGTGGGTDTTTAVLALDTVATGFFKPTFLTSPPGDTGRLFVTDKDGVIYIIKHGVTLPTPFLDISGLVSGGDEQGLLGLAFYPDYATSGRFIVSYTSPTGTQGGGTSVLARYKVSANPDVANPTADKILLTFDQPFDNHNGGNVVFGPDGLLWAGFGDGGGEGDTAGHAQNRTDLLGSMIRIDVSGAGDYTIPPSNPYATSDSLRRELWNYGLRNPWRFSFDRSTHDLYIGDVGQAEVEEVDVAPNGDAGGENYGWNIVEGDQCYNGGSCSLANFTPPVFTYRHDQGCAIIGGYVYRGTAIPNLAGTYFYGDECSAWVRSFKWSGGTVSDQKSYPALVLGEGVLQSFGEDARGELYVLSSATVYRIAKKP